LFERLRHHGILLLPSCAIVSVSLSGCGGDSARQPVAPPMVVKIVTVRAESLPNIIELPGRIEAVRTAEVRARTNGIVLQRLYQEGTDVRAGTPLFKIDPREYRARVQQAQAALQRAVATQANAASVVARYRPLVADRSVSGQENDAAVSNLRQAQAQVAEARAALAESQLQLDFTTVRAPIRGRVGRAEVTEGALVSGAEATLMTRVDQLAPMYAVFTQSNAAFLDTLESLRSGNLRIGNPDRIEVRLVLDNGSEYGPLGHLDFSDQSVDPQTGSKIVRAVFPNPEGLLAPGQFVRARVTAGTTRGGLAVPARAVQFQGAQTSVSVVTADGTVAVRPVQLGTQLADRWMVQSGLKAGERVVVDGWQKVRHGQKVRAQPARDAASAPTTASGR